MITEPEPSWEVGAGRPYPSPAPAAEVLNDLRPRRGRQARRPAWLAGALAGALGASVVWAGLAYAGAAPRRHTTPDLHGYRIGQSPCAAHAFDPLVRAVGARTTSVTPAVFEHASALDRAQCSFSARSTLPSGAVADFTVQVDIGLHQRTDPRAEFDSERAVDPQSLEVAAHTEPIAHLGDEAYLLAFDNPLRILKVRDGGAVITLRLVSDTDPGGVGPDTQPPDLPDLDRLTPALADVVRAMTAVMAG